MAPRVTAGKRLRLWRNAITRVLGERFGSQALRYLASTWQRTELGREHRDEAQASSRHGTLLIALWHGRGVMAGPFYGSRTATILVSASEDGTVATSILRDLGYEIIRGSSSRKGVRALREMTAALEGGKHLVITPDGPRGPMHSMTQGPAFLARATGAPVLPIGFAVDRAWRMRNWDSYAIPKRRARVVACYRPAIHVPRDISNQRLDELSNLMRTRMREAEQEAFAHLGLQPDWAEHPDCALEAGPLEAGSREAESLEAGSSEECGPESGQEAVE